MFRSMFRRLLPTILIVLAIASIAVARNPRCQQFFQKQVVVQQAVVPFVQPQIYYGVGQDLQTEALAERVAILLERKLASRSAAGVEYSRPPKANVPDVQLPDPIDVKPSTAMATHCAKCHNETIKKGGHVYDGITELRCSDITAAIRQIAANKMPKDHAIDPATKGQLMEELLNLEVLPARKLPDMPTPAPPVPMPEPDQK